MSNFNLKKLLWLNPVAIFTSFMCLVLYSFSIESKTMSDLYGEPNYINIYDLFVYLLFLIAFILGASTYQKTKFKEIAPNFNSLYKGYVILILITFTAYIIWFVNLWRIYGANIVLNLLVDIGSQYDLFRDEGKGGKISGVTTFTEVGIMAAPLATYILINYKQAKKKFVKISLCILFVLSVLRAAIFAERIAALEVIIPSIVVLFAFYKGKHQKLMTFFPIFAFILLLLIFGLFEYNRSWIRHYNEVYDGNIVRFTLDRVLGYYIVVINTECIQVNFVPIKWFPQDTLWFFWSFPGMSEVPFNMTGININYLERWGNPEYNNNGGLLTYYKDFWFAGLILQFFLGNFIKRFYLRYINRNFWGVIIYPIIVYGMLELPRYPFFSSFKMFFTVVAAIIFYFILSVDQRKKSIIRPN